MPNLNIVIFLKTCSFSHMSEQVNCAKAHVGVNNNSNAITFLVLSLCR